MRLVLALLLSIATLLAAPATAQSRHALVVGIDDYAHVAPLQKARNDARAVHGALQAAGFRADLLLDSDGIALLQGLERFVSRIEPGDEAVFFFAGHGVELEGENILLPADIPAFERGGDLLLRRLGLPVADVLDQMQRRGARVSLLILDACRDNPFPRQGTRSLGGTRGLARMEAPEGAYIMYSAGAGQAALDRLGDDDADPNSVFTRALLPRLTTPGLRLRDMVLEVRSEVRQLAMTVGHNQFPAVYDQLDGAFEFIPAATSAAPARPAGPDADPCASAATVWTSVEATDSTTALESFIALYGEACPVFAALAEERMEMLSTAASGPELAAQSEPEPTPQAAIASAPPPESVSEPATTPEAIPETATRLRVRPNGRLNARAGPGTDHGILETLAAGTELREIERDGEWSRVALSDNRIAWVHNGFIMTPAEYDRQVAAASRARPEQPAAPAQTPAAVSPAAPSTPAPDNDYAAMINHAYTQTSTGDDMARWLMLAVNADTTRSMRIIRRDANRIPPRAAEVIQFRLARAGFLYGHQINSRLDARTLDALERWGRARPP